MWPLVLGSPFHRINYVLVISKKKVVCKRQYDLSSELLWKVNASLTDGRMWQMSTLFLQFYV